MSIKVNSTDIKAVTFNNTIDKIIINGTEVWTSLPEWDGRGLQYNSWDTIQKWIQAGKFASKVSVGATKTFTVDNKTYTAEVMSINTGTGSAASWYPANTVDFITKELYETAWKYNKNATNTGGFPSSLIRTNLDTWLYPRLPSELQNVIVFKTHSYQSGSYSTSSWSWSSSMSTISTKLWLPTAYEIQYNMGAPGESSSNNQQYRLATKSKYIVGTSSPTHYWWLGSPYYNNDQSMCGVSGNGLVSFYNASYSYNFPICFRIG